MTMFSDWTIVSLQLDPALWRSTRHPLLYETVPAHPYCILDASVLPCLLGLTSKAHLCLKQNSYQKPHFTFFYLSTCSHFSLFWVSPSPKEALCTPPLHMASLLHFSGSFPGNSFLQIDLIYKKPRDFPSGAVDRTLCSQRRGHGFDPWSGN